MTTYRPTRTSINKSIEKSLNEYDRNINEYTKKLNSYKETAEALKQENINLAKRFYVFDLDKKCDICYMNIFTDIFYTFNCTHSFHRNCIETKLAEYKQDKIIENINMYRKALIYGLPKYAELLKNSNIKRRINELCQ